MFTGLITSVGRIAEVTPLGSQASHGKRVRLQVDPAWLQGVELGESIAVSGACMTVVDLQPGGFAFDISAESLARTTGLDVPDAQVNLEQSVALSTKLGGHLVTGHVDGVGQVARFEPVGESWLLEVDAPAALGKFFAYKGSIVINGVSLTVNRVEDLPQHCRVSINLIPHTLQHTNLHQLREGSAVNLEIDLIARYVERMLGAPEGRKDV
ncbi:MAG: riboflavin synthase [Thiomonas arsenitoxydans]|uniref:Riboflavin synthase n=1 Tax=Thiomonas arsenitoxydans (strain DSM 22701 / CIP 110005 / 3As) TaxID=426114 RepID=A0A8I1SUN2_THIA3|nr:MULTISPECIES: riboflavin synthase [Thiomonas]MBN8742733.1 riboflavin synthase [Thiomonas arsenitoxydans]ODU96591.1 MAG: riboflavin synthase subunit alpha [Thiomonas sp. SCN 64-16]